MLFCSAIAGSIWIVNVAPRDSPADGASVAYVLAVHTQAIYILSTCGCMASTAARANMKCEALDMAMYSFGGTIDDTRSTV